MKTITGALGRLFKEHSRGLRVKISTGEAVPVQQSTIGVLGRLFWHSIILQDRSTGEALPIQQSTIGVLGRLFWHSIILQEKWRGCAGTIKYCMSTG